VSDDDLRSEDLRRRFLDPPDGAGAGPDCPEPETFLRAVLGDLPVAENRRLASHAALCPSCTVAWRLAREYAPEAGLETGGARAKARAGWPPSPRWIPAAAALAAALALVAILIPWGGPGEPGTPVLRAGEAPVVESLVPGESALPRQGFVLRWSPGPEGSRYALRVTDLRLEHVAGAAGLESAEFTVPAEALEGLEPGALVLWQVELILPEGRRVLSETFATRLE
jgi:hypothetical protein